MPEWLDVFDDEGRWRGFAERDRVHREGLWHRTFHCWVLLVGSGAPRLLFQRRAAAKTTHPGCLDIAAAGHLRAGEPIRAGVREVAEELGMAPDFAEVIPLGVVPTVLEGPDGVDRERCHEFLWIAPHALTDFRPDPGEVAALVTVGWDDADRLFAGSSAVPARVRPAAGGPCRETTIRLEDFVPRGVPYYRRRWEQIAAVWAGGGGG
jgi:isopentenyldiphosphate isomerase